MNIPLIVIKAIIIVIKIIIVILILIIRGVAHCDPTIYI